jgi:hypothetical protein
MRKHASLAVYLATIGVLLPAGWHALEADIPADGALTRPERHTLTIDDAAIDVDLDRGLLKPGGELKVALTGTAAAAHGVDVDVTVLQDMGMAGERVSRPPRVVARRRVTVPAAASGAKPVELAFRLGGKDAKGYASWYDVVVTPASKTKLKDRPYEAIGDGKAAVVGAATWSGNAFGFTVEPPLQPPADQPFEVAVRIKNTTRHTLKWLMVDLGAEINNWDAMSGGLMLNGTTADVEISQLEAPPPVNGDVVDDGEAGLAPGAERVVRYQVKPLHLGVRHFKFVATATSGYGGAIDVVGVDLPEAIPGVNPEAPAVTPVAVR